MIDRKGKMVRTRSVNIIHNVLIVSIFFSNLLLLMLLSGNQNQFYINILPYFGYFKVLKSPFSQVDYGTILSMLDGRICNEYLEDADYLIVVSFMTSISLEMPYVFL